MANKKFWLGILVMVLVFGMMVVGCNNGSTNNSSTNNSSTNNNGNGKPYTEDDVNVTGIGLMHYYFSKTPEGLEQAAFDNGISYINPPIKNASWTLNPSLDDNVKNAMDSKGTSYSGTVYVESGITYYSCKQKI